MPTTQLNHFLDSQMQSQACTFRTGHQRLDTHELVKVRPPYTGKVLRWNRTIKCDALIPSPITPGLFLIWHPEILTYRHGYLLYTLVTLPLRSAELLFRLSFHTHHHTQPQQVCSSSLHTSPVTSPYCLRPQFPWHPDLILPIPPRADCVYCVWRRLCFMPLS